NLAPLPDHHLRIRDLGAPAGSRAVTVETDRTPPQPASFRDGGWSAVLPEAAVGSAGATRFTVRVSGTDTRGARWNTATAPLTLLPIGHDSPARLGGESGIEWRMPLGAAFEEGVLLCAPPEHASAAAELAPVGLAVTLGPATLPLRHAATITMALPQGAASAHVGLFEGGGDGWE